MQVPVDTRLHRAGYTNQPYINNSENQCAARVVSAGGLQYTPQGLYSQEPNTLPPCWSVPFDARGGDVRRRPEC